MQWKTFQTVVLILFVIGAILVSMSTETVPRFEKFVASEPAWKWIVIVAPLTVAVAGGIFLVTRARIRSKE
jgi:hypothetical protein